MRLDDLTIFLKAVDQTKKAIASAKKGIFSLDNAAVLAKKAFLGLGGAITTALVAASRNGGQLTGELLSMSRQINESVQESQALFLSVREADASANLDNLNEALLTLKERFADAETGAGPLLGLMQDFEGFDLDLGVDNARDQLADFLEQVSELDDANQKIFALKEVIGDEDARAFFNMINDTEKLTELLKDLRTDIEDFPGLLNDEQVENVKAAKTAANELSQAWDDFSIKVYALVSPALAAVNTGLTNVVTAATWAIDKLDQFGDSAKSLFESLKERAGLADVDSRLFLPPPLAALNLLTGGGFGDEVSGTDTSPTVNPHGPSVQAEIQANEAARDESLADEIERRRKEEEALKRVVAEQKKLNDLVAKKAALEAQELADAREYALQLRSETNAADDEILNGAGGLGSQFTLGDLAGGAEAAAERELARIKEETDAAKASAEGLQDTMRGLGNVFEQFANVSGRSNEKAFKNFQKFQIAMSTAAAVSAAIQTASDLPPGSGFARVGAYLSVLGTLLAGVAQLRSLSVGSGSVTSSGTSTPAPSAPVINAGNNPAAPQQNTGERTLNINITGVLGDAQLTELAAQIAAEFNDNDNIVLT